MIKLKNLQTSCLVFHSLEFICLLFLAILVLQPPRKRLIGQA